VTDAGSPSTPVRLSIANDYEIVVRGVAAVLEPHADRIEIVELVAGESPSEHVDVVLFDVFGTGEVHTGDVQGAIEDAMYGNVAVFTDNLDAALVETALELGVRGYLSKSLSGAELADAVVRVANGEIVVNTRRGSAPAPERRWPGKLHDLTEREAEVLALITQGYDNETIATRLYISPNTVKTRVRKLYRRMGFENRVQAAVWGVKHGFETDSGASSSTRS
jgi:two-component system, NarL family, response regulator LiaR